MDIKKIKQLIEKVEKVKKRIAKDRDVLRDLISEIECFEGSVTAGIENLDEGVRFFNDALDDMSQFV